MVKRLLFLTGCYFLLHWWSLPQLPIFADEAIYLRWAQLIRSDWQQYLFFPLNDGKTPLFVWLLVPFQLLVADPLLAGRTLALLVGWLQVLVIVFLLKKLGASPLAQVLGGLLVSALPFWYFHHQIALMDGLLTLCLSVVLVGVLAASAKKLPESGVIRSLVRGFELKDLAWLLKTELNRLDTLLMAVGFGTALLTKLPAILTLPGFLVVALIIQPASRWQKLVQLVRVGIGLFLGLLLFLALGLHPAFSQLFARGGDFLYSVQELMGGAWRETLPNLPTYLSYFVAYLTPSVLLTSLASCWRLQHRPAAVLFVAGLLFCLPVAVLGMVVYPRYFFPASLFFTLSSVLMFDQFFTQLQADQKLTLRKLTASVLTAILLGHTISSALLFIVPSILAPDEIPFVAADRTQYLTEWSSGHGIRQTVRMIDQARQNQSVAVATEGYFGTLPDALLLYFFDRPSDTLLLEGIGQPVNGIPPEFAQKAKAYDQTWLVVNSHRFGLRLPPEKLIAQYCRPGQSPCLQVWNITEYVQTL